MQYNAIIKGLEYLETILIADLRWFHINGGHINLAFKRIVISTYFLKEKKTAKRNT